MDFDLPASLELERLKTREHLDVIFRPLLSPVDHGLTKRHISSQIDLSLGLRIKQIEEILQAQAKEIVPGSLFDQWGPALHQGAQTWVGLDFQVLQTTYHDLKTIFQTIKPKPFEKIVDLGAGYGRIGIFLHQFYPKCEFLGLELVPERVTESNRLLKILRSDKKNMVVSDLSQIEELPEGDIFFIYDFGSVTHIKKILELLKTTPRRLLVVKGRIARQMMLKDQYYGEGIRVKKLEDVFIY